MALSLLRYPAFFAQPGAQIVVIEPVCALVAYSVAIVLAARLRGTFWEAIQKTATICGILSGSIEIIDIGIENGIPFKVGGPVLQLVFMLAAFALWGIAGFAATRKLGSFKAGLLAAIGSAGICMLAAVTAGFLIELLLAPPAPAYVSSWAEFQRSGWSDARAFGIANTFDSGFTHLLAAPVVATVLGSIASLLARLTSRKAASPAG
jgi:hypothetical protein